VTFAREGARVLLVDCDLRRPRLHRLFQVPAAPGLADLMGRVRPRMREEGADDLGLSTYQHESAHRSYSMFPGFERLELDESLTAPDAMEIQAPTGSQGAAADLSAIPIPDYGNHSTRLGEASPPPARSRNRDHPEVRKTAVQGLFFLSCGELPSDPTEAVKLADVRAVLEELSRDFHVIVLDTPPVLVSADAAILAPLSDSVLMVIRAGQTDREAASLACQQLAASGAPVVGAVLNDPEGHVARHRKSHYSYDYAVDSE
jgi:Mrp family chromosome partitioning ATPase